MIPLPIETERLCIRGWQDRDLPRVEELFGNAEVMEYIPVRDPTAADMLARYRAHYDETGLSFWALAEKSGRVVGEVGFHWNDDEDCPELGWLLARDAWGRGYATEAARAAIAALFSHMSHDRIVALVDTRNERSLRTAERIGMRAVRDVDERPHPHRLFEVTRS